MAKIYEPRAMVTTQLGRNVIGLSEQLEACCSQLPECPLAEECREWWDRNVPCQPRDLTAKKYEEMAKALKVRRRRAEEVLKGVNAPRLKMEKNGAAEREG